MKPLTALDSLVAYGIAKGLISPLDEHYVRNRLLELMGSSDYTPTGEALCDDLETILGCLLDEVAKKGLCGDDVVSRDLFDTKLMAVLTPFPREVVGEFFRRYDCSPKEATDWFYELSGDTDYIRRYRIQKDRRWKYKSDYGELDITINLSKPEKDPNAIAAAKNAPVSGYPYCQLCRENEGYAGHMNHPARQNHRVIPVDLQGEEWFFQYSPYVYYNEHCILLGGEHRPMKIDKNTFLRMFSFVEQFPHYFIGSNADLPIVGGSILSHDHFQGGNYLFPMEKAPVEERVSFSGYEGVSAGILRWPMSVIRLEGSDPAELCELGEKLLSTWRSYTDEAAVIYAETDGEAHNTITPIARYREGKYQLDLVLRNNLTTKEHPLGLYHPHEELHHIKKENIGLIEVMGLAVLPARLQKELAALKEMILRGDDLNASELTAKHAPWAEELKAEYTFTSENIDEILEQEVGRVFQNVLLDAGVYKRTGEGKAAFLRFLAAAGGKLH